MIIDSHCHLTYEPMSNALKETINRAKKDDIFNYNLELKNLDILFKKVENDN